VEDEFLAYDEVFWISIPCLDLLYGDTIALGDFMQTVIPTHQMSKVGLK